MDISIHGIKTFRCLAAPEQPTKHKTMRVPCKRYVTLGGLLNALIMAVDFTKPRRIGCLFVWQCYIAKYP